LRGGKVAVFFAAAFLLAGLSAAGCGCGTGAGGKPTVIFFWQPDSEACEVMETMLAQLEEEYGNRVNFQSYNRQEEREKAEEFGIGAVPTFLFMDAQGNIIHKVVGQQSQGFMREKMESLLSSHK